MFKLFSFSFFVCFVFTKPLIHSGARFPRANKKTKLIKTRATVRVLINTTHARTHACVCARVKSFACLFVCLLCLVFVFLFFVVVICNLLFMPKYQFELCEWRLKLIFISHPEFERENCSSCEIVKEILISLYGKYFCFCVSLCLLLVLSLLFSFFLSFSVFPFHLYTVKIQRNEERKKVSACRLY